MKTRSLVLALVLVATSCVLALDGEGFNMKQTPQPIAGRVTQQENTQELAQKSGCLKCHGIAKKVVGPAYSEIAKRYKDDSDARRKLIDIVKHGGKGNWVELTGGVPMPPHSARLSSAEIERLVDWVLKQQSK